MSRHVIIDGNNLQYALAEHGPSGKPGRETLLRIVERWSAARSERVTIVFDGPVPRAGFAAQMSSPHVEVLFGGAESADDVIVRMIHQTPHPATLRVVSSDNAIRHEARYRKCGSLSGAEFVAELYAPKRTPPPPEPPPEADKPPPPSAEDTRQWLDEFELDKSDPPFDGHDAMSE